MRAVAPGKLLLTGAYAVLEGAPAVVAAIDRYAVADSAWPRAAVDQPAEVRAAFGDAPAPDVDVRALQDAGGRKLGLGSSSAALVAALAAQALSRAEDLRSDPVRRRIFGLARASHARAQAGGSGVDVAASVYGGVLRYVVDSAGEAQVRPLALPRGLCLAAYDSGASARTTDMRARFDALCARTLRTDPPRSTLCEAAAAACAAVERGDREAFIECARRFARSLVALGQAADAPVVPPRFAELAVLAEREEAAFLPSGAGGGDVAIWLGTRSPSPGFAARAEELSMHPLALGLDPDGVRAQST